MFCGKCGLKIKDGETVCHGCGTPTGIAPKKVYDPANYFRLAGSLDIAGDLEGPVEPEPVEPEPVEPEPVKPEPVSPLVIDIDDLLRQLEGE